jgi:hypothetical protein
MSNLLLLPVLLALQPAIYPAITANTNDAAVKMALADILLLPIEDRQYILYIWREDLEDLRTLRTISLAINFSSQSPFIYRPPSLFGGKLIRLDLRNVDPAKRDWPKFREQFAFDPNFALLLSKDTINFIIEFDKLVARLALFGPGEEGEVIEQRSIRHGGGALKCPKDAIGFEDGAGTVRQEMELDAGTYDIKFHLRRPGAPKKLTREQAVKLCENVNVVRFNSPDIDPIAFARLQQEAHSLAPIVSDKYFKFRTGTSIQEEKLYKDVFGGLYFELKGIRESKDQNVSDLDLYLQDRLVLGKGEKIEDHFNKRFADLWAFIIKSAVTAKPRAFEFLDMPTREVNARGALTYDIFDDDIDIGQRAFARLVNPWKFVRAIEGIFPGLNGLPECVLFKGDKKLQREAPSGQGKVVDDTTRPAPNTHRLFSYQSCLACHGGRKLANRSLPGDRIDFWQPIENDALKLYRDELNPNKIYSFGSLVDSELRLRLIGQYTGNFQTHLARNRLDYASVVRQCVELGPGSVWEGSKGPGWADVGQLASEFLSDEFNHYWYDPVTAEMALREIGIIIPDIKGEEAADRRVRSIKTFNLLVPVLVILNIDGLITEHPTIKALRNGLDVSRQDWALVRSLASGSRLRKAG